MDMTTGLVAGVIGRLGLLLGWVAVATRRPTQGPPPVTWPPPEASEQRGAAAVQLDRAEELREGAGAEAEADRRVADAIDGTDADEVADLMNGRS